ncbi:DEAD/DEAH box helicase family protein [Ralstonia solanacearum]|uniref:type I restriction endonuclease subunit R n=1 Tax=Ralstonia solanacearum TaxID=305 RepID=UPI0005C625BE|nr:DEAD/DEAH box helicase family protein [Ralstonia solanacearum]MBB6589716.1 DEAD/DEAH box helicase family protein [Ralstonia solanacearum]MBB6593911.1 DEAD/DEAH box helicase family protein [Ralstonia solanacearum]MDB0542144.1 DEAD/DEAH box helicase family protein [Ralstonia solanacearum]MDB0551760.1 DEAD/DEAH box helicase family protein [Ralstonia solanacearum]MDB0557080.1 DEAD/DEAH box helicase family protein [Ralstonia solanacearum]
MSSTDRQAARERAARRRDAPAPDSHAAGDDAIDRLLRAAGWPLTGPDDTAFPITGLPTPQGKGYVDYVLWGDHRKPLAIVEARHTRRSARAGRQRARQCADCLEAMTGQRPLIYCTNGRDHWFWDDRTGPPRAVRGFHRKDELERLIERRTRRQPLTTAAIDTAIAERPHQHRAIRRIAEAFEQDRLRGALVSMPTGTGKTRTAIALTDLLMRCHWIKRTLFLADRAAQLQRAAAAFATHLPGATLVDPAKDAAPEGNVYLSTCPAALDWLNGTDDAPRFGPGHFDLVIVDVAHRGICRQYRAIFSYFDALLVGLTATPKEAIDRNTYDVFGLAVGVPTDAYGLDEAIADHHLVPPRTVSVPVRPQREGIRYDDLSDMEKDRQDTLEWDDDNAADASAPEAADAWLHHQDAVDEMIALVMEGRGHRVAGGDWIGKTLIFARNHDHARFIAGRFDANYPQYKGELACVITYEAGQTQTLVDAFSVADRMPRIAISAGPLDIEIAVPEVVNLVFFRRVRSRTRFWRMVGCGTRPCQDLYGPGQDKQDVLVFDFCRNLAFFNVDAEAAAQTLPEPLGRRVFRARLELLTRLQTRPAALSVQEARASYGNPPTPATLHDDIAQWLHRQVASMSTDNFAVRAKHRYVCPYTRREAWLHLSPAQAEELAEHVSGLPTTLRDDSDEAARRFDLLMLRLQLCVLRGEPAPERLKTPVRSVAKALLAQTCHPAVRDQAGWLAALAEEGWWSDTSALQLEQARRRLRPLAHLIDAETRRQLACADCADTAGPTSEITVTACADGTGSERFRAKARGFLRARQHLPTLRKLRHNEPLTATDLAGLEQMLVADGVGSGEDIDRARRASGGLGVFVRGLIGLDRAAATAALSGIIGSEAMTTDQREFIDLVITHLTGHGTMDAARLYASPFTDIAPQGPDGLFAPETVDALVTALRQIKAHAVAT